LLYSLNGQPPKQAAIRGGIYGLGLYGFGASWIYVSIYNYGGESAIISSIVTGGFVIILAAFSAALGWLFNKFWPADNIKRTLFAFPVLWVALEILRGWIFTGFPWLFLGYSQADTNLMWLAPLGSVWLISWAVAFNAGVIFETFKYATQTKKDRKFISIIIACALIIWIGAGAIRAIEWTKADGELTVALVQGNIPQVLRWDPKAIHDIADTYKRLTIENLDVDLIIWPESAIPTPLPYSNEFFTEMSQIAAHSQAGLIAGVPVQVENKQVYYNALVSLGQGKGIYYKRHLVPFGEYVPFDFLLRGLIEFFDLPMSSFIKGPEQPMMITKGYKVAPAICYEIAYPFTIRSMSQDSHVIVTVSNDAWFGRSLGPKQHLQIAQLRALETGRYVLRATNNGITAIIGPDANITGAIPQFHEGVLRGKFSTMVGATPWMLFGPWALLAWLSIFLAASKAPAKKKKKK